MLRTVKKWKYTVLALGIVCLVAGGSFCHRPDPTYAEVRRLVGGLSLGCLTSRPNASEKDLLRVQALLQLGPKAYPILASFLQGRDTKAGFLYMSLRARFPNRIQRILPARESKDALRLRTKLVIEALGPTACRELVGPVCHCIRSEPADAFGQIELLRALNWALPDSPEAVATLQDWLSKHAPNQHLSSLAARDWSQIPQLASTLALWLCSPDDANIAAQGLGAMGSHASLAVPQLIETVDYGAAGPGKNVAVGNNLFVLDREAPGWEPLVWNRIAAIEALGNLGIAAPEVLSVLGRASSHPYLGVRATAAKAIGKLGPKAVPLLPELLQKLDTNNPVALEYQIDAIGRMGASARPAIPVLRYWAAASPPVSAVDNMSLYWEDRPEDAPLPLPGGAAAALLQIAPEETVGLGAIIGKSLLLARYDGLDFSYRRLCRLRPLAKEIAASLERTLYGKDTWRREVAAFCILCLQPDHSDAELTLKAAMDEIEPRLRAGAAVYYWRATGETSQVLPCLSETLATVRDLQTMGPLSYAGELGPVARPLVPQVQTLLTNREWWVRQYAGQALRRIDPGAFPPVKDRFRARAAKIHP